MKHRVTMRHRGGSRTLHFRSKAAYRKWVAYGHIHKLFETTPGSQRPLIRGKAHRVKHAR